MPTAHRTAQELAEEACRYFTTGTRAESGTEYVYLLGELPEWLYELVREAHGDMLPDDYVYASVRAALEYIVELEEGYEPSDAAYDFAESEADVYNHDLSEWLGSHAARGGWVDEASEYAPEGVTIYERIRAGQMAELRAIFESVSQALIELELEEG